MQEKNINQEVIEKEPEENKKGITGEELLEKVKKNIEEKTQDPKIVEPDLDEESFALWNEYKGDEKMQILIIACRSPKAIKKNNLEEVPIETFRKLKGENKITYDEIILFLPEKTQKFIREKIEEIENLKKSSETAEENKPGKNDEKQKRSPKRTKLDIDDFICEFKKREVYIYLNELEKKQDEKLNDILEKLERLEKRIKEISLGLVKISEEVKKPPERPQKKFFEKRETITKQKLLKYIIQNIDSPLIAGETTRLLKLGHDPNQLWDIVTTASDKENTILEILRSLN